jgi:hypothetical protein
LAITNSFYKLFLFHDGISAITKPFTNLFFTRWNLGYLEAFSQVSLWNDGISAVMKPFHKFFFHMVESRLSQSLFTNFSFSHGGILAITKSFSRIFLSHGGISAITKPFHKFFLFTRWNPCYHEAFSRIFHFTRCTIWGKTLFIYITKSIYIGSTSLKTLLLDLEPPFQGKDYGPPYSNEIAKKENAFVPEITYRFVTQILILILIFYLTLEFSCVVPFQAVSIPRIWLLFASLFYQAKSSCHVCFFCYAWPFPGFMKFPWVLPVLLSFEHQIASIDVFSNHFLVFPCLGFAFGTSRCSQRLQGLSAQSCLFSTFWSTYSISFAFSTLRLSFLTSYGVIASVPKIR